MDWRADSPGVIAPERSAAAAAAPQTATRPTPTTGATAWLPFTVTRVRHEADLLAAVSVRHAAYHRHLPHLSRQLESPEPADLLADTVILLARSKLDGSPLGTMRIQTNARGPLPLERSVTLPLPLPQRRLAEATRLGVALGESGRLVKLALFKAFYLHCLDSGVDDMVIASREPLDRLYRQLQFEDVFGPGFKVPLQHAAMVPHAILRFGVATAYERWTAARHPLMGFMCHTHHPDLIGLQGAPTPAGEALLPH
jgi:hypothetical protein